MGTADPHAAAIVARVQAAVAGGAPDSIRLDLHPYLRWTLPSGERVSGRTRVLTMLVTRRDGIATPSHVDLRDGQVYRWVEPGDR